MKVIIASDTHGHYGPLSDYILENGGFDLLIHAGDGVEDVKAIGYETSIPYHVVRGNNDYFTNIPYEKIIEVENHKIFLCHGHTYNVNGGYDDIIKEGKSHGCDIVVFGHTHRFYCEEVDDMLILNPGSVSLPRDRNPGFMVFDFSSDQYTYDRIRL